MRSSWQGGSKGTVLGFFLAAAFLWGGGQAVAAPVPQSASRVITLGTMAGPMANADRRQPATLLAWRGGMILVDVGDGALDQMARAGVDPVPLKHIILTHIHADHIGGLFALLTRRYQLMDPPVTLYGPVGTKAMVDGLLAAMAPLQITSPALSGATVRDPAAGVSVVEITDGTTFVVDGVTVRAAANSHYGSMPSALSGHSAQSLSLRIDLPGRSVALTGDTGPSASVVNLARGADLLVSSILDLDAAVATIKASRPQAPPAFFETARAHFAQHHLSARAAGELAHAAGVRAVLLTHIGVTPERLANAKAELAEVWKGPLIFAADLGVY